MAGIENVSAYANTASVTSAAKTTATNAKTSTSGTVQSDSMDAYGLDMSDFLSLMVAQFTNQTMDNTADISDMLNQLVQMQMVTALNSMSTAMETMTDQSIMSYAASLVGKEVTVAGYDQEGNYAEVVGTVTATGSYGGEQVIFVDDAMYYMTQIIAVGRLPETSSGSTGSTGTTDSVTGSGAGNGTGSDVSTDPVEGSGSAADSTDGSVENSGAAGSETPAGSGENTAEGDESNAAEESGGN